MHLKWFLLLVFLASPAFALTAERPLSNAAMEAHAQELFYDFRCVVCQGQSLAESDALLAQDIRKEIRAQLTQGKNDRQIRDYLTARFGNVILMSPPFTHSTALLWLLPGLLLMVGGFAVRRILK